MSLKALSDYKITSNYAKYIAEKKRRETWEEVVERSLDMHLRKFENLPETDLLEIKRAFQHVKDKEVLPSMRSAQFGGIAVERKNERIYNCCFLHIHNTRTIEKAFYLLLCGVGCGFGLGKKWVAQFPKLNKEKTKDLLFYVEDSIEGWATSTKALVDSYLEGNELTGTKIKFNYSFIRPNGAPLSHGGVAPGPDGLRTAHERITTLLESASDEELRTIDVYDILMHVSDAVLSGGIRRAACIALFDKDDDLMMRAKTGNWYNENPQRMRSNNTVLLKRDETTLEDFKYIIENTKQFGEPGFAFVDDLDVGLNPCAEISFLPFHEGIPAVQFCNLTTINGNKVDTIEKFKAYVKAATIIGTLQASYTDFKFLDEADRKVTEEEALLGVSILGVLANPQLLADKSLSKEMAEYAVSVNEEWAKKIGINPAARVTCIKPDGNSSCVLESPFSGIHPAHHRKYFRRVQANKSDAVYQHFRKYNAEACEPMDSDTGNTTDVITFPIALNGSHGLIKDDLNAIQHLDIIKDVQDSWVKGGEKNNKKPINHSVSCTVLVNPDEWETVAEYLYENRWHFTAVALLARTGDKDYKQAPYEAVKTPTDFHIWNSSKYTMKPVDYKTLIEEKDTTARNAEVACAGGVCEI